MTWDGSRQGPTGTYARYLGSNATITSGGWFGAVGGFSAVYAYSDLDPTGLFVYSNGTLTFSDVGLYRVKFRARAGSTTSGLFGVRLLLNGSSVEEQVNPGWSDNTTVEVDLPFRTTSGDVITLDVYNNTGGSTALRSGQTGTMFSVTRYGK
jgi:hypothetical protein